MASNPQIILIDGPAGSGKTTLVYRMSLDLSYLKKNHYIINIDPASSMACCSLFTRLFL